MATANSVLKLVVDDKEYKASIKQAQQGMQALETSLQKAGKGFNDVDKEVVKYVRDMGKMETNSKTTRGKIGELTTAFVELSQVYNRMSDEVKTGELGRAMSQSLEQIKQRTIDAKNELQELSGQLSNIKIPDEVEDTGKGGLFSSDKLSGMLQVFGGNMMTKGLEMATGAAMTLVNALQDAVSQGIEMARSGEGIRIAFERLNQPGLLDKLREATHGTVTDLELMKQAVKFNDFNLSLDEMGTLLAFAQQKAKDTGQSVDYMVDSIVTGLGRQSLMILDNLGLSASEIRDRMKESGDMTKAVADIIRDRMEDAGGYIETAADKAMRADVDLKNAMEDLGRTLLPLEEQGASMWTTLQTGAINALNEGVKPLVPVLVTVTEKINDLSGVAGWMGDSLSSAFKAATSEAVNLIGPLGRVVNLAKDAARIISQFIGDGNNISSGAGLGGALGDVPKNGGELPEVIIRPPRKTGGGGGSTGGRSGGGYTTPQLSPIEKIQQGTGKVNYGQYYTAYSNRQEEISVPVKPTISEEDALAMYAQLKEFAPKDPLEIVADGTKNATKQAFYFTDAWKTAAQAVQTVGGALAGLEDPAARITGTVAQAIANIALGYSQAMLAPKDPLSWIAFGAMGLAQMISTIAAIKSATSGYAEGGIVKGTHNSGDNEFFPSYALNAGELVLTKAMQGNLASQLQGGGLGALELHARLRGEDILLSTNNTSRRMGRGQFVTTRSY